MTEEVALIEASLTRSRGHDIGMRTYHEGELLGRTVVLAFSRWGKVAAASTATTMIEQFGADIIVFTGVAGGADPDLDIGDVVVADELVQHDMDASAMPMFEPFEVPLLGVSRFRVAPEYHRIAAEAAHAYLENGLRETVTPEILEEFGISNPKAVSGLIASGDQFIADSEAQHRLRRLLPRLLCVEMEGAAVAQVCYEHSVPFVTLRAVSDKADSEAVINFSRFVTHAASPFSFGIVSELLQRL
jgi:adenosylhomocysteine nucleosidase